MFLSPRHGLVTGIALDSLTPYLRRLGGQDYGRHPDFKLAYVTLAKGETFEFPRVVNEEGEGDITKDIKDRERATKYMDYMKQQNWKKKFGGPNWFS